MSNRTNNNSNPQFNSQPDPYFEGHQVGIEQNLAIDQQMLDLEQVCYDVFVLNESGKRMWEIFNERFISEAMFNPSHPQAANLSMYFEGFKEGLRGLYKLAKHHERKVLTLKVNGEI